MYLSPDYLRPLLLNGKINPYVVSIPGSYRRIMGDTPSVSADIFIARFPDSVILSAMVFIVGIFYGDLFSGIVDYLLMFLSLFLVIFGIYLGNSYYDRAECIEAGGFHLQRDEYILKGTSVSSMISGLLVSLYFGALPFLFASSCALVFLLYNVWLKRILLLKGFLVGFGFAIPLIYGALIHSGGMPPLFLYFIILSFLAGFGIEILCDIRDTEEDKLSNVHTLPIQMSGRFSAFTTSAIFAGIIVLDLLPFFWESDAGLYGNYLFLLLIMIPVIAFAAMIVSLTKNADPDNAGRWITYARPAMLAGSLAYVLGVTF